MSSKTLNVINQRDSEEKILDVETFGNTDQFVLLCKASSKAQCWMKSTKAMEIPGLGCLVQVSTQHRDNVAEALTFVPGACIGYDEYNNPCLRKNTGPALNALDDETAEW